MIITFLVLLSILFVPLSCIVVWRKYSYLGDGLVHASMLSSAMCSITKIPIWICLFFSSLFFWFMISILNDKKDKQNEIVYSVSGFMTSIAFMFGDEEELESVLFGDISLVSQVDIYIIMLCILIVYSFFYSYKKQIILMSINSELALSQGIKTKILDYGCLFLIISVISINLVIVGGFLIPSLLIIPSISAFNLSKTPKEMMIITIAISLLMSFMGYLMSCYFSLKIASCIVFSGFILFLVTKVYSKIKNKISVTS